MVLLYIHLNPVAGLCSQPDQCPWSSRGMLGRPGCLVDLDRLGEIVPMEAVIRGETQGGGAPAGCGTTATVASGVHPSDFACDRCESSRHLPLGAFGNVCFL